MKLIFARIISPVTFSAAAIYLFTACSTDPQEQSIKKNNNTEYVQTTVVSNLDMPWAVALLPDGRMLVTERTGKLRIVKDGKVDPQEVSGVPKVLYRGQGGLLDVVLHPDYEKNGWVYLSYSSPKAEGEQGDDGGANTALMRAKLNGNALVEIEHLYKAFPNVRSTPHFGGKIAFDGKGYLFMSLGERGKMQDAQSLEKAQGKVIRLHDDGKIPTDNPFVNTPGALKEIWSYGHRNPQGLIVHPTTGVIWEHEHGPQGGDELNIVERGKNYGWPLITYGINYNGDIISEDTAKDGLEQPVIHWTPSIAPSGMALVSSDKFKDWKGDILVGSLKFNYLKHLKMDGNKVLSQNTVFEKIGRVRDIKQGPDGYIYVVVEDSGSIIKIAPKS